MIKKKTITIEEYQNAIAELENINKEKTLLRKLNQTSQYQAHITLPETLDELLLTLKKENENLDNQIRLEKKKILEPFQFSRSRYQQMKQELDNYLFQLSTPPQEQNISLINSTLLDEPTFLSSEQILTELIAKKSANTYLQENILTLLEKEQNFLKSKKIYEKNQEKKTSQHFTKKLKKKEKTNPFKH